MACSLVHNRPMEETASQSQSTNETSWGPYQLKANPLAILRLSLGSAACIATALLIPDIVQLMLVSHENIGMNLRRFISLWSYAYILWATGFICILHIIRIFSAPLILDSTGIKLDRFGKKIPWSSIEAVAILEKKLFSRFFMIPAYQMTLHIIKENKSQSKRKIFPGFKLKVSWPWKSKNQNEQEDSDRGTKQIASFLFLKEEFYSLFYHISEFASGAKPRSLDVFVFKNVENHLLKKLAEEGKLKRLALTIVISFGLLTYFGRKIIVNYNYNMGNKEFNLAHYYKAIGYYAAASAIEFSFAPAWDGQARAELREGDIDSAEDHWKEALKWKPDYVEAKLGLSRVYMLKGQIDEADRLIAKANRLAPLDEASYINRAQIDALMGKNSEAIAKLEDFVKQQVGRERAICILARSYIRRGDLEKAEKLLSNPELFSNPYTRPFCIVVQAELALEQGKVSDAKNLMKPLRLGAVHDPELMLLLARIETASKNYREADKYIERAARINKTSPWLSLAKAELAAAQNRSYEDQIQKVLAYKYSDSCLLAAVADFYEKNGKHDQAVELARKALTLDPVQINAKKLAGQKDVSKLQL